MSFLPSLRWLPTIPRCFYCMFFTSVRYMCIMTSSGNGDLPHPKKTISKHWMVGRSVRTTWRHQRMWLHHMHFGDFAFSILRLNNSSLYMWSTCWLLNPWNEDNNNIFLLTKRPMRCETRWAFSKINCMKMMYLPPTSCWIFTQIRIGHWTLFYCIFNDLQTKLCVFKVHGHSVYFCHLLSIYLQLFFHLWY